jgi:uncharacterized membrane protein
MEQTLRIILILHIVSGFLSLLAGCLSILSPKGKKLHRASGKVFFYGMLGVTVSALIISIAKNNSFLLMIAIFSGYQAITGYRAIQNKSLQPAWYDWVILVISTVNTFFMIYSMNLVLMVFGGISCFQVIGHFRENLLLLRGKKLGPLSWLKRHIGMMMGAYIAAITAFVVVNAGWFASPYIPQWLPWLLPSVILGPLIGFYIRKHTGKSRKQATEA